MLGMTDFADALRRAFPGSEPFTAAHLVERLERADMPTALQYALARQDRGERVGVVQTAGRVLMHAGAVRAGKTRDGAILWTAPGVL